MNCWRSVALLLAVLVVGVACSDSEGEPPSIVPVSLANGVVGAGYQAAFTATGKIPNWSVSRGALPDGLAVDPFSGAYTGTPTASGSYTFTLDATSAAGKDSLDVTHVIDEPAADAVLLLSGNRIATFSVFSPSGVSDAFQLAGVAPNFKLVALDYRAANGWLYGLAVNPGAATYQMYVINAAEGLAVPLAADQQILNDSGVALALEDVRWDIDSSPVADRIRVINAAGKNYRVAPNSGGTIDGNSTPAGVQGDSPITGAVLAGIAFTNNDGIATHQTLYGLSAATDSLYLHAGNSGGVSARVPLSRSIDDVAGFDIRSGVEVATDSTPVSSGSALAVVRLAGETEQSLVSIDLVSGEVTVLGRVAGGEAVSFAVVSGASAPFVALSENGGELLRFDTDTPTPLARPIVGQTGIVVALDWRPATGQLMALAIDHVANLASLYRVDPVSGTCTLVGDQANKIGFVAAGGAIVDLPDPAATSYAMEVDPRDDRVRVVTSSGLNFRVNPGSGLPIDGDLGGPPGSIPGTNLDGGLNGLGPTSSGLSEIGATNTDTLLLDATSTLYALDAVSNLLCIQKPPRSGTQSECKTVTLAGAAADFTEVGGFDIPAGVEAAHADAPVTSGFGYVMLKIGDATGLYTLDLPTAALTLVRTTSRKTTDLAVGRTRL